MMCGLKPRTVRNAYGFLLLAIIVLLIPTPVSARINVVTLPGRQSVQLTIYNSADLTLVKETRLLTFKKGLNRLEFSWANTLIDPTSVELRALTHAAEVDVLDVSFPPRVNATLEWRINSEFAGEVQVEIRYFTSGITWSADYVAEASKTEQTMNLAGAVRVTNNSGEDYENAQIRLVVGVVRLVEDIATLARAAIKVQEHLNSITLTATAAGSVVTNFFSTPAATFAMNGAFAQAIDKVEVQKREIIKEGFSEYFLYTVEGRDSIPSGWSKRLPSFNTPDVPVTSYYKFEREQWGDRVIRYYRFTNSEPCKLGKEPLPNGTVNAFRYVTPDNLHAFVGRTSVKYIPVDESAELELGRDQEVLVKPTLMNWEKTNLQFDNNSGDVKGWTIKETWQIEVQNSKDIDIMLDVRRNFTGDWTLTTGAKYEKVDATKVKFVLPLKARVKQKFTYELTMNYGSNVVK